MKNILLLTDFSENSINAIKYALKLFETDLCTFYLLNVQTGGSFMSDDLLSAGNDTLYHSYIDTAKHKLSKLVIRLMDEFKCDNFTFETMVDFDSLTDAINQITIANQIDLVVLGSNGVTGAKEILFGSNTKNVIRKVKCDTLVIPEKYKFIKPKNILLPLDPFDYLDGTTSRKLLRFINKYKSFLHVLRINPDDVKKTETDDIYILNRFIKDHKYSYHVIREIPLNYVVETYLQTNVIDLICLLIQKETMIERLLIGSPTTKISSHTRIPLLIYHLR